MADEFITVARVVKTQGRRGEVAAELHTDFPERFAERKRLFARDGQGGRRELRLQEFWPHQDRMVLKFAGVDSISDAEALVGCELQIPRAERTGLEAGAAYVGDLIGCTLVALEASGAREVGRVADVDFSAGEAPLLVVQSGRRELLVPFASEFVRRLDTAGKRIEMALPEGMLELDAPLSEEERREQKGG